MEIKYARLTHRFRYSEMEETCSPIYDTLPANDESPCPYRGYTLTHCLDGFGDEFKDTGGADGSCLLLNFRDCFIMETSRLFLTFS